MLARGLELKAERREKTSAEVASTGSGQEGKFREAHGNCGRVFARNVLQLSPRRLHWLFRLRGFPSRVDASIPLPPSVPILINPPMTFGRGRIVIRTERTGWIVARIIWIREMSLLSFFFFFVSFFPRQIRRLLFPLYDTFSK